MIRRPALAVHVGLTLLAAAGPPALAVAQGVSSAASRPPALPAERTGADIYRAACITCHGADGKGSPITTVGFEVPLPDFSDCAFATGEPDPDWQAVVHEGGRIRGL